MADQQKFDVIIAGAGVTGLALAHILCRSQRFSAERILLVEAEAKIGQHVSSRNSEVIHAGIYYPRNSLKADLCVRGKTLLYEFCDTYDIAYNKLGKLLISNNKDNDELAALKHSAEINGVQDLHWWNSARIASQEPALRARHALHSPSSGVIDSHGYMERLLQLAQADGLVFAPMTRVVAVEPGQSCISVHTQPSATTNEESFQVDTEIFINAAGLNAQGLAQHTRGLEPQHIPMLYPCKGDYFSYQGKNPFRHLIYPLPESNLQGLGIHSTQDLAGQLRFGPDATYVNELDYRVDPDKAVAYAAAIAEYFPALDASRLAPDYAGIRPKLAGPGAAAADFLLSSPDVHGQAGVYHLFGIESPGLTSSLALAEYVLDSI